jgi:hypothetical protein
MLESARRALEAHAPRRALDLTRAYSHEFNHGKLAEECEVLAIQAVAAMGDHAAARTRAKAFRQHYSNSIFSDLIDTLTAPNEAP